MRRFVAGVLAVLSSVWWRFLFGPFSDVLARTRARLRFRESAQSSRGDRELDGSRQQSIDAVSSTTPPRSTAEESARVEPNPSETGDGASLESVTSDLPHRSTPQTDLVELPPGERPGAGVVLDASVPHGSVAPVVQRPSSHIGDTLGPRGAQSSVSGNEESSDVCDDETKAGRSDALRADEHGVDERRLHEGSLQPAGTTRRADSYPPLDVQREQLRNTGRSPDESNLVEAESSGRTSSFLAEGLSDAGIHGREVSSQKSTTVSTSVRRSCSEDADQAHLEDQPPKFPVEIAQRAAANSRTMGSRQPTPRVDAREYVVLGADTSTLDTEYARWNTAIVEQLVLAGPSSDRSLLCVNPRILSGVFEEAGFGSMAPDQAEQQFTTAVAGVYQRRVLRNKARLHVLRRCFDDGPPCCVAFLAGSVLAAFYMQSDEELSGNAYYKRLAGLLRCGMQGTHPHGFDPAVFESLWVFLDQWLRNTHGRALVMPETVRGFRRFVALPLAHVPLRSLDTGKLPVFFAWAGYQPGARLPHERLLADLKRWQRSTTSLTATGADALRDDRSATVAAQVSAELKAWDGACSESDNSRSALVELQFDVVQRVPILFYLPRRPTGFPTVFEDEKRVFEASGDGWYDPGQLTPEDGALLESGFEWRAKSDGVNWTLRRRGNLVIPFAPSSNYSGFLSGRRLLRGVKCSVLCRDSILPTAQDYLSEVAQAVLRPISHSGLPNGWSMFRDFSAQVHVEAPSGLETLEVDPGVELILVGGLRIGRTWSWVVGAPPRVLAAGMKPGDHVTVNGASLEVSTSGELLTDTIFNQSGQYVIEAGTQRRKIEMTGPQTSVRRDTESRESANPGRSTTIALPRGSWTLIGRSPLLVHCSHSAFFHGTIASCPFDLSWAVQVGAGPGAIVAVSAVHPAPPQMPNLRGLSRHARRLIEQWSSIVYAAHIRHPRFVGLSGVAPEEGIVRVWRAYVTLAKEIKRHLRRGR